VGQQPAFHPSAPIAAALIGHRALFFPPLFFSCVARVLSHAHEYRREKWIENRRPSVRGLGGRSERRFAFSIISSYITARSGDKRRRAQTTTCDTNKRPEMAGNAQGTRALTPSSSTSSRLHMGHNRFEHIMQLAIFQSTHVTYPPRVYIMLQH
jgi:hypothetical protein